MALGPRDGSSTRHFLVGRSRPPHGWSPGGRHGAPCGRRLHPRAPPLHSGSMTDPGATAAGPSDAGPPLSRSERRRRRTWRGRRRARRLAKRSAKKSRQSTRADPEVAAPDPATVQDEEQLESALAAEALRIRAAAEADSRAEAEEPPAAAPAAVSVATSRGNDRRRGQKRKKRSRRAVPAASAPERSAPPAAGAVAESESIPEPPSEGLAPPSADREPAIARSERTKPEGRSPRREKSANARRASFETRRFWTRVVPAISLVLAAAVAIGVVVRSGSDQDAGPGAPGRQ